MSTLSSLSASIARLLGVNPVPWILESDSPSARLVVLTGCLGPDMADDPAVDAARAALHLDAGACALIESLQPAVSVGSGDHHAPSYLPNRLNLLADMGFRRGDDPRIERVLDEVVERQHRSGRFGADSLSGGRPRPERGSLVCDTNAMTDVLLRFGRHDEPTTHLALARLMSDASLTPQGRAWRCIPERRSLLPSRERADACPQISLEGLRAISQLPPGERPEWTTEAARVPLRIWERRISERPYDFGHGYQFKTVKWPNFWYDVLWVLETVTRFPGVWTDNDTTPADRRSLAELAACLIAYNFDASGNVAPDRLHDGFETFPFGRRGEPSPFATALALRPLTRLADLVDEIRAVDVESLPGSVGGTGTPIPPTRGRSIPCPTPSRSLRIPLERVVPRILSRHHLLRAWEPSSLETVVGDIVGLQATVPDAPGFSAAVRMENFTIARLEDALYGRHSLAFIRGMRGSLFTVRTDHLPMVFSATRRQTVKYSRDYARFRGVTDELFEEWAPRILEAVGDGLLSTRELRARVDPPCDAAALVNRMVTECLLTRDRPEGAWPSRRWRYRSFERAFPGMRTDIPEERADIDLVRAYVRAFAPVSAADISWWSGIGPRRTAVAVQALGDELTTVDIEGVPGEALIHSADVDELASSTIVDAHSVVLLPALDPLIMGYADKSRFVRDEDRALVFDRAGHVTSVILVDGRVAGVWDFDRDEDAVLVHTFEQQDLDVRDLIALRARDACALKRGCVGDVRWVASMRPVAESPVGAVWKPLRTTAPHPVTD